MKKIPLLIFIIPLCLLLQSGKDTSEVDIINLQGEKLKTILRTASLNYVDSIDIEAASNQAFDFLLKQLDRQCQYYDAETYASIKNRNAGRKIGVGLGLILINDTVTVFTVDAGSPADSAGIIPGDRIIYIDGGNVVAKKINEVNSIIKGRLGEAVTIVYRRGGGPTLHEVALPRKSAPDKSISTYFTINDSDIGFIHLNRFSIKAAEEFVNAMKSLKSKGIRQIIVDLRGNPGGLLEQASIITGTLLKKGRQISSTKVRNEQFKANYQTTIDGEYSDMPVIVIVNNISASGSEILAGAIQDYDRGIVIGEKTFGKGSVQKIWEIKDGSAFKLTVGNYLTPLGRNIQKPPESAELALDPAANLNLSQKQRDDLLESINKYGGKSSFPVFNTAKGRILFGGGGIFPDYSIAKDTTTMLSSVLKAKQIINEYSFNYLINKRKDLLNKYDNAIDFNRNFAVSDSMLIDLKRLSVSKNIWNNDMYIKDREYLRNYIKASIAQAVWGVEAGRMIVLMKDKLVIKAIELLPEARKILNK